MHPAAIIAIAAASGLAKGLALSRQQKPHSIGSLMHSALLGPITEELTFRAAPLSMAPHLPRGLTAIPFALAHVTPQDAMRRPGWTTWRLAETAAGGALYEAAYRSCGIGCAVAAHGGHNLAVALGAKMMRKG